MSTDNTIEGLAILRSNRAVSDVMERLQTLLRARGIKIFAHIDFSADASAEGIHLRPTQMLILGNPKAGTPLIEARPTVAIDLPLKILAWSDDVGGTTVAYNDPDYLRRRHGFPPELIQNISGIAAIAAKAAGDGP
jgi:uncharacterized protein (DUF302 family)